jgi:hypothetical protein
MDRMRLIRGAEKEQATEGERPGGEREREGREEKRRGQREGGGRKRAESVLGLIHGDGRLLCSSRTYCSLLLVFLYIACSCS